MRRVTNTWMQRSTGEVRLRGTLGALVVSCAVLLGGCGGASGSGPTGDGTTGGGTTDPSPMQTPGSQPTLGTTQTGDGTYYGADGSGNCSYEASPGDLMVAAMNDPQYNNSAVCGMCVDVTGPKGTVTVRIVDRCPECKTGDLDLSQQAFVKIADQSAGRVKISWVPVECATAGPVAFRFKEGSSQYWMGVQLRNSRMPINKMEMQQGSSWLTLNQQQYNYYLMESGPGPGPFTFRVTSTFGQQQLTQSGVVLKDATVVQGTEQFK